MLWAVMRYLSIFSLLPLLFISGCETTPRKAEADPQNPKFSGFAIEFSAPATTQVATEPGEGYRVHFVRLTPGAKSMMGIYEGQHPKLFSKKERALTISRRDTTSRGNIERGDNVWGIDGEGKYWRESVWSGIRHIPTNTKETLPVSILVHMWYFGVTQEEAQAFDAIIDTLDVTH